MNGALSSSLFNSRSSVWFEFSDSADFLVIVSLCPFDVEFILLWLFLLRFNSLPFQSFHCSVFSLLACGTPQYCFYSRCFWLSGAVAVCITFSVCSFLSFTFPWFHCRCTYCYCCAAIVCSGMACQFVCGAPQPVRGFDLWADSMHAEFIMCTSNEVYCADVDPMFLVNEPRCGAAQFSSDFQFSTFFRCFFSSFLSDSFFKFSSFQCSCLSSQVLHFFGSFPFHFFVFNFLELLRFDCRALPSFQFCSFSYVCLSFQLQSWRRVPFGWRAVRPWVSSSSSAPSARQCLSSWCVQVTSARKLPHHHHRHCYVHPLVSILRSTLSSWSSFNGVRLQLPKFSRSLVFRLPHSSNSRCVLHCPVFWFLRSFLRFSVFDPVGRRGTPFRLSGNSSFLLRFSGFRSCWPSVFDLRDPIFRCHSPSSFEFVSLPIFRLAVHFHFSRRYGFRFRSMLLVLSCTVMFNCCNLLHIWIHVSRASSAHIDLMYNFCTYCIIIIMCIIFDVISSMIFLIRGSGGKENKTNARIQCTKDYGCSHPTYRFFEWAKYSETYSIFKSSTWVGELLSVEFWI